jgi:mannosyltransferase
MSSASSQTQSEGSGAAKKQGGIFSSIPDRLQDVIYGLALMVSISAWFIAIRAPLWLDETGSFQQISAGFSAISSRQGLSFPAYSYILWFCTKILGTGEIALRIPEILAMLGSVYLLYLAARELFDRDAAFIATIIFCLHPVVVFASIDVRPYAFGALAINAAILCLIRLRRSDSNWLAALFGFSAACIVSFHFLFGVILPALAIGFFVIKTGDGKTLWRQFGIALAAFTVAFLPVALSMRNMVQTSGTHVFAEAPALSELGLTLAPGWLPWILLGAAFIAALVRRLGPDGKIEARRWALCALLGLVPILILYGTSAKTPLHVFVARYRLVAIPGIALCWGAVLSLINSRAIRLLFCVVLVAATAFQYFRSPYTRAHGYTWKYALEFAEKNASADRAPVLICSDFTESDHVHMPVGPAVKDSALFAPLSYYKLSGPVVGLPRTLNDEAIRVGSNFLLDAAGRGERFLVLGYIPSYKTLYWLANSASGTHYVHELGESNGVVILEFQPRTGAGISR